jgi:hypothetical protein
MYKNNQSINSLLKQSEVVFPSVVLSLLGATFISWVVMVVIEVIKSWWRVQALFLRGVLESAHGCLDLLFH